MEKTYRITLFGKKGCDKCKVLNERIDGLLKTDSWQSFEKAYVDIASVDGLVSFVKTECLNPQRIPAFIVEKKGTDGGYKPIINPKSQTTEALLKPWRYVGVETDYSEKGRGVITPQMITSALEQAKTL